MSTRATFEFKHKNYRAVVQLSSDGYPSGASIAISKALLLAWKIPRFDAGEFAAALVAANKTGPGGAYIVKRWQDVPSAEFHYVITLKDDRLNVAASSIANVEPDRRRLARLFAGTFEDFRWWALAN
jgi:hypothetical protein